MGKSSKYKGLKCAYAAIKLAYMTINWTEYLSAFVIDLFDQRMLW